MSYTRERKSIVEYDHSIAKVEKLGIKLGTAVGFGFGFALFAMFSSYALATWYDSKLVINGSVFGGIVLTVVFAIFIGGR